MVDRHSNTLLSVTPDGSFEQLIKIYGACICMPMHGRLRMGQLFRKIALVKGGRVNFLPSRYRESHRESF